MRMANLTYPGAVSVFVLLTRIIKNSLAYVNSRSCGCVTFMCSAPPECEDHRFRSYEDIKAVMVQHFISHKVRVTFGFMPQNVCIIVHMCTCISLSLAVFCHVCDCGSFVKKKAYIC